MTSRDETIPLIETVIADLWRSFFDAAFDALRGATRASPGLSAIQSATLRLVHARPSGAGRGSASVT